MSKTTPRPWLKNDHLWSVIETDAGNIAVHPLAADRIMIECAHGNMYPALKRDGQHGSSVIDIGRGVGVRVQGFAKRDPEAGWMADHWSVSHDSGGDVTPKQFQRAVETILPHILGWISTHAGDIAQADDIERNNGAHRLEEQIAEHQEALRILRTELRRCEAGKSPWTMYPKLPTDRR